MSAPEPPRREFVLTGGIGAGKSTVAAGLVERGAVVVDADEIVRELQEPGGAVFAAMVEHFGDAVLAGDGGLDRQAVADIVFADPDQLEALNKLVHPAVGKAMGERREELAATEAIVVVDIPLMVTPEGELGRPEYDEFLGKIVVDCDIEVAVERLMAFRHFPEADARARIAKQATRAQRVAHADHIIDNSGSLEDLEPQLDACWSWMLGKVALTGS